MVAHKSLSTPPNCAGRRSSSSLKKKRGWNEASPKKIIKAYYLGGYTTEDDYLLLLEAVEDRNRLSHIYDAETFNNILARLPGYAALFERISSQLTKEAE